MELANAMRTQDGTHPIAGRTGPTSVTARRISAEPDVTTKRPSSARRLANLHTLVAEFAHRDIGRNGVAELLGCSPSASRNYIAELLDARVVFLSPARPRIEWKDRTQYRLTDDPIAVQEFLAGLADPLGATLPSGSVADAAQRMGRNTNFGLAAGIEPARRDPLVAALFGAAGHS
jgi:hypothetical protein